MKRYRGCDSAGAVKRQNAWVRLERAAGRKTDLCGKAKIMAHRKDTMLAAPAFAVFFSLLGRSSGARVTFFQNPWQEDTTGLCLS